MDCETSSIISSKVQLCPAIRGDRVSNKHNNNNNIMIIFVYVPIVVMCSPGENSIVHKTQYREVHFICLYLKEVVPPENSIESVPNTL